MSSRSFLLPGLLVGGTVLAVLLFAAGGAAASGDAFEGVAPNGVRYRIRKMGTAPDGTDVWSVEVFTGETTSGFEFVEGETLLPFEEAKQAALAAAMETTPP
jgi:hypothetical protein